MVTSEVRDVFAILRPALTELVAAAPEVDASFLAADFAPDAQRRSPSASCHARARGRRLAARPDRAPVLHVLPNRDVRLTTRYNPGDLESVWSTLPRRVTGCTRTESPTRCSGHRSQALPRSASTSRRAAPGRTSSDAAGRSGSTGTSPCRRPFPLREVDLDLFVRAINRAEPGLIRVDADETTYTLHIILRFELEQELLEGTVALEDLPEVWNAA